MMKVYTNRSSEMRTLYFTDGTAVFMFRGQTLSTDKAVTHIPDGVRVKDAPVQRATRRETVKEKDLSATKEKQTSPSKEKAEEED